MPEPTHLRSPCPPPRNPPGITLLEVLVACGILVIGLAGLASIMPAAGSRLAQASVEDRAGATAVNAFADVISRGLASSSLFSSGTKACVFGLVLPQAASLSASSGVPSRVSVNAADFLAPAKPAVLASRIDLSRGFVSEDDLVYLTTGTGDTPSNLFLSNNLGPREYREGVCWGGMLTPAAFPAASSGEATLSIAVFRKPGDAKLLTLTGAQGSPLFEHSTQKATGSSDPTGIEDEQDRKTLLTGCSYVLAIPLANATPPRLPPRFVKITSSWTTAGPGAIDVANQRRSFLVLDLDPLGADIAKYLSTDTTDNSARLNVIAFENLIRVDTYTLTLD